MNDLFKTKDINGIIIGNFSNNSQAGMDKAIILVDPYLRDLGINFSYISVKSIKNLVRSSIRFILKSPKKIDFVLFNALASFWLYPYSTIIAKFFGLLKIPVFIYWRELDMAFQYLEEKKPTAVNLLNKLVKEGNILHLTNSKITALFIKNRYPWIEPITVMNCAYVDDKLTINVKPSFDNPIITNSSSIQYKKGIDLFISTAIKVCKDHPTVEFIWMGSGKIEDELQRLIFEAGFSNRILFPGFINKPELVTRKANLVFIPSRQDSFSQATAEAMCLAKNIVVFESGGPVEILDGTGFVIKNFDTEEAAKVILNLLAQSPENSINNAARQKYFDLYTPEVHAKRLSEVIRKHVRN
jgi:glycosyltransferase involved in cell wall biosynthesis